MTLGWTVFVLPFLFVFSNTLLLAGDPWLIALDCATAVAGVWLVSAGTMGYARRPLGPFGRVYCAVAGLFLMLPAESFPYARWLNIAGAAMAVALMVPRRQAVEG
jgi:TRAP-type uncharacterized transport system fused permease subunit